MHLCDVLKSCTGARNWRIQNTASNFGTDLFISSYIAVTKITLVGNLSVFGYNTIFLLSPFTHTHSQFDCSCMCNVHGGRVGCIKFSCTHHYVSYSCRAEDGSKK